MKRHHLVARDRLDAVVERVLVALVGERPDQPDLAAHVVALDPQRRPDDEDVDAEPADELGGLAVDAAVDVDLATERLVAQQLARGEQLVAGDVLHERLATEARLDGHHQDDVEELRVRLERRQRRRRLDREPGRPPGCPDPAQGRRDLLLDLDVEGDRVAAGLEVLVEEAAGLVDHQVRVERQLGPRSEVLDGLGAERQVRDEVGVHDVEVDPVAARPLDPADGVRQVGQVGIEDARGDPRPTAGHGYSPTPTGDGS